MLKRAAVATSNNLDIVSNKTINFGTLGKFGFFSLPASRGNSDSIARYAFNFCRNKFAEHENPSSRSCTVLCSVVLGAMKAEEDEEELRAAAESNGYLIRQSVAFFQVYVC